MWTTTDIARELGVERRAEARQAALGRAVRLAQREQRRHARRRRAERSGR